MRVKFKSQKSAFFLPHRQTIPKAANRTVEFHALLGVAAASVSGEGTAPPDVGCGGSCSWWPTFSRGPTFAFLRVLGGPSCPSQDAKRVRRLCVSVEDLSFTPRGSGWRQVALGLGSEQSQASPKQRTQRSQAEHQRASPAPRRRKKRVACSRRKPGDGDPTKHSKEPLSRRRRR